MKPYKMPYFSEKSKDEINHQLKIRIEQDSIKSLTQRNEQLANEVARVKELYKNVKTKYKILKSEKFILKLSKATQTVIFLVAIFLFLIKLFQTGKSTGCGDSTLIDENIFFS